MTLHLMECLQFDNCKKYVFKAGESHTNFLLCLNAMKDYGLEEK
jgi:hypothetical protein